MAEQGPSSQADEQEENAQLVEAGSDDWGMYRDTIWMCWNGIRKGKAQMKWDLARDVENNCKGFFKYSGQKRKAKESVPSPHPLQ